MSPALDDLPGYRRRFRITPGEGRVLSELEDDYHHMRVTLRHADGVVTAVEPEMVRAPWTTCPGATEQLKTTFVGLPLVDFPAQSKVKFSNCTHLYDLAILAAAHAADAAPLVYDVLTSDPVDGRREIELRRNGEPVMHWGEQDGVLVEPPSVAGTNLMKLRSWIETLDAAGQEQARVLQWGAIVAHGRDRPIETQSDATQMPATCFTFQPENKVKAVRVGEIRDVSRAAQGPLEPRTGASPQHGP